MKKKLLMVFAMFMAGTAMMNAQFDNIGILGGSTPTGWDSDADMTTTDGITYTYSGLVITVPADPQQAGVKFRKDDAWTVNWGGNGFPSGTATQGGANIPATNGTWDVTFNKNTGAYSFTPPGVTFDTVVLTEGDMTVEFSTGDGITYTANNVALTAGGFYFTLNGAGQWAGSGFPTGTATSGTATIPVTANSYNITFNKDTGAYAFNFVIISITGSAVGGWGTDTNMNTTDGVNYMVNNVAFAADGDGNSEIKFRLNNDWAVTWGNAEFPSGTAEIVADGGNMVIPAGSYNVTFNRETGAFAFTDATNSTADFAMGKVVVFPNPANSAWTFAANNTAISNIQITDLAGKVVLNQNANGTQVTVNAASLANGVYFARVNAGQASQVVKVVKN